MYIIVHMRTTLNIDATLIREASKLTGVSEKTALVRMGLEALIAKAVRSGSSAQFPGAAQRA
jgi:Arc/MetJ family transcription regulator